MLQRERLNQVVGGVSEGATETIEKAEEHVGSPWDLHYLKNLNQSVINGTGVSDLFAGAADGNHDLLLGGLRESLHQRTRDTRVKIRAVSKNQPTAGSQFVFEPLGQIVRKFSSGSRFGSKVSNSRLSQTTYCSRNIRSGCVKPSLRWI